MKLSEKTKNILTVIAVVLILWGALTVTFTPDVSLSNMLVSMVKLPEKLFHFVWDGPAEEEEEPEPTETTPQKPQLPLVLFDEEETPGEPVVIIPIEGVNQLPEDTFVAKTAP